MKKFLFLAICAFSALVMCVPALYAQDIGGSSPVFDFSTFAGIVAVVSLAVTQGARIFPFVNKSAVTKILSSVAVSMVIILVTWHFKLADFLAGLPFWQVIVQGLLAGLSACGAYDLIKNLFKTRE